MATQDWRTAPVVLGVSVTSDLESTILEMEHRLTHHASFVVASTLPPGELVLDDLRLLRATTDRRGRSVLLELPGRALVEVLSGHRSLDVRMRAVDHDVLGDLWLRLRRRVAELTHDPGTIRLQLWSSPAYAPVARDHDVPAVQWDDVRRNYSAAAAGALDTLVRTVRPAPSDGRLVLWHGPPGTGKTTAVAALATAWLPWCETHVVTDPEDFFHDPDYLMSVEEAPGRLTLHDPLPGPDEPWPRTWKLIVCEDADEYLRSDARQRSGPALGRLLNLTDGLMGKGRDTVVLLTTNDDVGRLHPAVTRPGRCLAKVEIPPLSADEAAAWLPTGSAAPQAPATLAELYAAAGGAPTSGEQHRTGLYL